MNIKIDKFEAMRYLGCKVKDDNLQRDVESCIDELRTVMTPRFTYEVFEISTDENGVCFKNSDISFQSKDLAKLLKNSEKCVLMAATLGSAVDKKTTLYQHTDMSKAVVFDACASAAIEGVCDFAESEIKRIEIVKNLTMRFSAGYGDFDISAQKEIVSLLGCYKKIGLTVTPSMLLTPTKSVTAIIGITDFPYMTHRDGCDGCSAYDTCPYRINGTKCER